MWNLIARFSRFKKVKVAIDADTESIMSLLQKRKMTPEISPEVALAYGARTLLGEPTDWRIASRAPESGIEGQKKELNELQLRLAKSQSDYEEMLRHYSEYLRDEAMVDRAIETKGNQIAEMKQMARMRAGDGIERNRD
jgi:hypothetical protein